MYIELHARSAFSFLQGASLPETLIDRCVELDMPALAMLDVNNLAGAVRLYRQAKKRGVMPHFGAEVPLADGSRLPLLVENQRGYRNLCRLISRMNMRSEKGMGVAGWDDLSEFGDGLIALTGGASGPLAHALATGQGRPLLENLTAILGRENVYLEIQRHYSRAQEVRNQRVVDLSAELKLPLLATNGVCMAEPADQMLLDVLTCTKNHTTVMEAGRLLSRNPHRALKPAAVMAELFADLPQAIAETGRLSQRLDFDLSNLGYRFPAYPTPAGETMDTFLRQRTEEGARRRYGKIEGRVRTQLDRELELIAKLHLAGYFLIVWDLVQFCERNDILTQGRGSAANSAVCYALGITAVDPIGMDLLFERFLSEERGEWPDIDLDLPSGDQREAVIQYVYEKYGRRGAAMTSVVITYQGRSAIREIGKALSFPMENLERLTKLIPNYSWKSPEETVAEKFVEAGFSLERQQVRLFHDLLLQILELPRHLGQHPGGMVICENDLDAVVPMEPATMPDRSIIQWDKDDCAHMGLIKVDLLGLGMMAVLKESINLIDHYYDEKVDLAHLPPDDPEVYRALQKADTIGWFQVESRAQMSSLPRTMPANFYDLVVQVAIIRPGPIVGEMAHPYMRRRQGLEPPTSLHPSLEQVLKRTLGVPLFQEQLLRMAMIVAGFSGGEAEELRRALGSKRSKKAMEEVEANLRRGMAAKDITGETQDKIVTAVTSFALYGFPESHAASFALLAYASGYLKCRYLVPYIAAMLNNLPMGFYSNSPTTLIKDAQKHGAHFLPVHVNHSEWRCTLERPRDQWVVRLGLNYVRKLRSTTGEAIVAARNEGGPFQSVQDVRRRVPLLKKDDLRALSAAGAFNFRFGEQTTHRRSALWAAELVARSVAPLLGALDERSELRSPLHAMNEVERVNADLASTGLTIGKHPFALVRPSLKEKDVAFCGLLSSRRNNSFVKIAGIVICRQRPSTARGIVFLSVEDESGMVNVILMPDTYDRFRLTVVQEPYLLIRGIVQNYQNAVSVKALWIDSLRGAVTALKSHDFH